MISEIYNFVQKYNLCPQNTKEEWLGILNYMQDKGWLHCVYEDRLAVVLGAYRIEEYNDHTEDNIPTKEQGNILYVPFAASESKDRFILVKMLRQHAMRNDIKEVVFNKTSGFKRMKLWDKKS